MDQRKPLFSVTKKDLEIQTFRSGGPGGQKQNKTETGVRIIHKASGARGESRTYRTQFENKKEALRRLAASDKFKLWVKLKASKTENIESVVDKMMQENNLRFDVKDENNRWVKEK